MIICATKTQMRMLVTGKKSRKAAASMCVCTGIFVLSIYVKKLTYVNFQD